MRSRIIVLIGLLIVAVPQAGCGLTLSSVTPPQSSSVSPPIEPDPRLTPGAVLPVTSDDICRTGYSKAVRNVPIDVKRQAYEEYGIFHHMRGEFEVDHLISLELGGSNSIKNLWPESYKTQPWNAHVKDQLEDRLHDDVCSGQLDIAAAQRAIATDWIAAYKKEFHTDAPLSSSQLRSMRRSYRSYAVRSPDQQPDRETGTPAASTSDSTPHAGMVWVNTRSGKFFRAGSKYYGHTKQGKYMSESDAKAAGYIAAKSY